METTMIVGMVQSVIGAMAKHTGDISVNAREGHLATVLEIGLHPDDLPIVMGPSGRTAESLRQIMRTISASQGRHFLIDIRDPFEEAVVMASADWDDDNDYEEQQTLRVAVI